MGPSGGQDRSDDRWIGGRTFCMEMPRCEPFRRAAQRPAIVSDTKNRRLTCGYAAWWAKNRAREPAVAYGGRTDADTPAERRLR